MRRTSPVVFAGLVLLLALVAPASAPTLATLPDLGLMEVRGRVLASAVQADGKVVIGGDFTLVNGVRPNNPAPLDHFVCYKTAAAKAPKGSAPFPKFAPTSVAAVDALAPRQLDLKTPLVVCNPGDANGEDPTVPAHAAHLEGYAAKLTKTAPPQAKPVKTLVGVTNDIGPLVLQVKAPDRLLVPSAKELGTGGAPALGAATVDHFTCYKAKVAKAKKGEPPFPAVRRPARLRSEEADPRLSPGRHERRDPRRGGASGPPRLLRGEARQAKAAAAEARRTDGLDRQSARRRGAAREEARRALRAVNQRRVSARSCAAMVDGV